MARRPNRSTTKALLVRMTEEEKQTLEDAAAKSVAGIPRAKMSVSAYVLQAALEKAQKDLKSSRPL